MDKIKKIPLERPFFTEREVKLALEAIGSRSLVGDGDFGNRLIRRLNKMFPQAFLYLTPSCSHALELACMALGLKSGDEVIMPSFNFPAAANAVLRQGAKPVFAEIEEETMNLSPKDLERRMTKKTKAVIPVHYAGVSCDMDAIMKIARKYNLKIIEDAAQAFGAYYRNKPLGSIGDAGCVSFHQTKNISCGEGGLFLTRNLLLARKAEIIREKGTDRNRFLRGEVDKYSWRGIGSSFLLSDIQSAVLLAQSGKNGEIITKRKKIYELYMERLKPLEAAGHLKLPAIPAYAKSNYHIFHILLGSRKTRDRLSVFLNKRGVSAVFHFIPLHSSPFAVRNLGYAKKDLPLTERLSSELLRLPVFPELTVREAEFAADSVHRFFRG